MISNYRAWACALQRRWICYQHVSPQHLEKPFWGWKAQLASCRHHVRKEGWKEQCKEHSLILHKPISFAVGQGFGAYPYGYCTHFSPSQTNTTWSGSSLPKIRPLLSVPSWLPERISEHLNPCVLGRKEKDFIGFSARFKLLCVIQHQGYYLH